MIDDPTPSAERAPAASAKAAPQPSAGGQRGQTRAPPPGSPQPESRPQDQPRARPRTPRQAQARRAAPDRPAAGPPDGSPRPIERPRERLLVLGTASLADVELLALVLGGGHAIERATLLLRTLGGLHGIARALPQELLRVPGIGEASASSITAALELARRLGRLHLPCRRALRDAHALRRFARSALRGADQEIFMVIGLDARLRVQIVREVGLGTVAAVTVHPREVFRPLVRAGAHSALLVHNHPSGEPKPSHADIELTERLVDVGWLLGVPVLDHLIVSDGGETSLAESGLMPSPTRLPGLDLPGVGSSRADLDDARVDRGTGRGPPPTAEIHDRGSR